MDPPSQIITTLSGALARALSTFRERLQRRYEIFYREQVVCVEERLSHLTTIHMRLNENRARVQQYNVATNANSSQLSDIRKQRATLQRNSAYARDVVPMPVLIIASELLIYGVPSNRTLSLSSRETPHGVLGTSEILHLMSDVLFIQPFPRARSDTNASTNKQAIPSMQVNNAGPASQTAATSRSNSRSSVRINNHNFEQYMALLKTQITRDFIDATRVCVRNFTADRVFEHQSKSVI